MLAKAMHDEQAREDFVRQLTLTLDADIRPRFRSVYEEKVRPGLIEELGREPDHREIAKAMRGMPLNNLWYALRTHNQERMHVVASGIVERQRSDLINKASQRYRKLGSLELDPDLPLPRYLTSIDIHRNPGGYHTELVPDDVSAGAAYDRVISVHTMGTQGPNNDDCGVSVAHWVRDEHPALQPRRILDLGCTVGHFTLPFKQTFPDAEVHGIDVAAPCLRYAHARACAQRVEVHFQQQNEEATDYEGESFDLIVSRQLLHETSLKALKNIFRECRRLLRPGGLMIHQDAPQFAELDAYTASLRDWDAYHNNEPFMAVCYELPLLRMYGEAGFEPELTFGASTESRYFVEHNVKQHATRSAGGRYFFTGAKR